MQAETRMKALAYPLIGLAMLGLAGQAVSQDAAIDPAASAEAPVAVEENAFAAESALTEAAPEVAAPEAAAPAEEVENPYGLAAAWNQGDFVSKGAFIILGIMSAATWYVMILKLLEQGKLLRQARQIGGSYWDKGASEASLSELKTGSPFWHVADRGFKSAKHHDTSSLHSNQQVDRATWIQAAIVRAGDDIQSHLQGGLAVLATVGSTAPFVGLFGTVWGIYHALTAIGVSGQASIDKVAGPVGEALIMTALGLAVAVPAVMGYNWLVRRNKTAVEAVRSFGDDLHSVLLSGSRIG
jgi:biopolymer transport protein ExbB